MKILIVLHGAIGDVARALMLPAAIKKKYPDSVIAWAVEPKSQALLESVPGLDEVIVFERKRGLRGYSEFINKLKHFSPDISLDLQRHLKSGVTSFLSGAKKRYGFPRKFSKEFNWLFSNKKISYLGSVPKYKYYQEFLNVLGCESTETTTQINASTIEEVKRLSPADNFVCFLTGSTWKSRLWKQENWASLARAVVEKFGCDVYLVGSPDEEGYNSEIARLSGSERVHNMSGKFSLNQLKGLFSISKAAVATDSGPMHLADVAGSPVVSIWGPTNWVRSAPINNQARMLVSAAPCRGCFRRECPGLDNLCLNSIPQEAILAHLQEVL